MSPHPAPEDTRGLIGWMTDNRVTPNLMMIVFLIGGFFFALNVRQEVFPEFDLDLVIVRVPYPGSSPEEVEQGIILAVEEAIRGLEGIKEITAVASEGFGTVTAEIMEGFDRQRVYQDIKQEIDRITTFPEDAERPRVSLAMRRQQIVELQLYGDVSEWVLREVAEEIRDGLLQEPGITQVELAGARDYELQVLIPQETLRAYGLTLQTVADRIRAAALELPGGHVETSGGEILLRMTERRLWAREFARIPIVTTASGTVIRLEDIAEVRDDFADMDQMAFFDGKRAVGISIFRVGDQTPIGISEAVQRAMRRLEPQLPEGVRWVITQDRADVYRQRLTLLLKNAFYGLMLVILLLGLFLEIKLALWVMLGIPISFLGSFLFLPSLDVTINMVSMFAYIIALGIVVDDAIVVGENIYEYRNRGMGFFRAAVQGARDVAMPVSFSILTNIVAFLPLYFIPGVMGKIWKTIPLVVVTVFTISWIESTLILPVHLAHARPRSRHPLAVFLHGRQQAFSRQFERFVESVIAPLIDRSIHVRFLAVAVGIAGFLIVLGIVLSGRIGMILMPRVESDFAAVRATLPFGSAQERGMAVCRLLMEKAQEIIEENGKERLSKGVFAVVDEDSIDVRIFLTDPDVRPISTTRVTQLWREKIGSIPGLESILFEADRGGPGSGAALTIELSHRDIEVLDRASEKLAALLADFPNVKDINDGYTPGKQQLNFRITPEGQSVGLTVREIARQIRNAFYGAEALRQQRGRNEIRVRVKFPPEQRRSEYDVEELLIRTPVGTEIPLRQAASVERGRSYTSINRKDGRRTVTVTANVEPIGQTNQVKETLVQEILPKLQYDFPGLSYAWEGRQADWAESMHSLWWGFLMALASIYAMLAIPFRSYVQPLIVMVAIPFGIVGAVLGHLVMGYELSVMSMMGIVALSGVVVNDSLVLIDYANRLRRDTPALSAFEAMHQAAVRRFRPVMLTTLTTFGGLAPMIFETSRQARFMIPMAISLGFGILFSTVVTLILVPCLYVMVDDAVRLIRRFVPSEPSSVPAVSDGETV